MAALPRPCPLAKSPARPRLLTAQVTEVTIDIPVRLQPVRAGEYPQTRPHCTSTPMRARSGLSPFSDHASITVTLRYAISAGVTARGSRLSTQRFRAGRPRPRRRRDTAPASGAQQRKGRFTRG
jgi:hypothetical protein